MISFILNHQVINTPMAPGTILLDFIRYHENLMGTKIGCREGDCGACTVLVGQLEETEVRYLSFTSCLTPLGNVQGKHVLTIEGLCTENLNPIQQAFVDESASQCGFCTPGFIVSLTGFILSNQEANNVSAIASLDGNICRCTGYKSIERAAAKIVSGLQERDPKKAFAYALENKFVPEYLRGIPQKLLELTALPKVLDNDGASDHLFLGGGTDLYVQRPEETEESLAFFLYDEKQFKYIRKEQDLCVIGGEVTATDLGNSEIFNAIFPNFTKHLRLISSTPIRNMATIGGNFTNASPIGDFTIFFLALNAQLKLQNARGSRNIPLRSYYKGYKQINKEKDEFISEIYFEIPPPTYKFNFEKVSKRTHLDIASVNSAISIAADEKGFITAAAVSAGGVGPVPKYLPKTSAALVGQLVAAVDFTSVAETLNEEISPISDARGSEAYKRLLLLQLLKCHLITLYPESVNGENYK